MYDRFRLAEPMDWPTSLLELEPAEHLVVLSFRRWALAQRNGSCRYMSLVWNEFARRLGAADGTSALSGFISIIRTLQEYAGGNVHHHQPWCRCLGADERWLVEFVGACQRGDAPRMLRLAERMVLSDGVGDLIEGATRLARAMKGHALLIPFRNPDDGLGGIPPSTIH